MCVGFADGGVLEVVAVRVSATFAANKGVSR